ncbi:hypothetical protein A2U01_0038899, partial [Trifolium medium]|nr:hypothetical protein [Trifolium medium]
TVPRLQSRRLSSPPVLISCRRDVDGVRGGAIDFIGVAM